MKKKFLFFFLGFTYCTLCLSQIVAKTEKKEIYFRIIELETIGKDSIQAYLNVGLRHGLKKGLTGSVKATYTSGENRANQEIGFGSLIALNDSQSLVLIRPVEKYKDNKTFAVRLGDYIVFPATIPVLEFRSIFFELATMDIYFNDGSNKPYYTLQDLIYKDSKQLEREILQKSSADVVEIYEIVKNLTDTAYNVLKRPFTKGRYIGKSVFDVMRDCKPRDIYTFLNFVKNYPSKYIAKSWKSAETFATWVQYGAYFSKSEVKDSVLTYAKNPILLKQFIEKHKNEIIDEDFVDAWVTDALEENDALFLQSMLAAKLVLYYLPNNNNWGSYYNALYNRANDKKDYKKAVLYCDSAIIYFKKINNHNGVVTLLYSKAFVFYMQDKNDESLQILEEGFKIFSNPANEFAVQSRKNREAYYYRLKAFNLYAKGELLEAAKNFSTAYSAYKNFGDFNSIKTAISCQTYLAKIYKKQGETLKALDIYKEQLALYIKLNDRENIASTTNDVALANFNLANYREAIKGFLNAKSIYMVLKDYNNAGYTQSNIGQAFWNLGKYDSAVMAHEQAIALRKLANNFSGLGFSWEKIGGLYKLTGEKDKAFNAYDSATHYYTLAKDTSSISSLLSSYGDVYYNDKQYQKAFAIFSKWNALNYASNNKPDLVNSLYWLAVSAYYFNDDTSKKYSLSCLKLANEIGDKSNEYYANTNLGSLSYKAFNYDEGNTFYNNALTISINQKNKDQEASLYRTIGSSYNTRLDFDRSIPLLKKSLHIYDSLGNKTQLPLVYRLIGSSLQSKGDFYEARKYYDTSIRIAMQINNRAEIGYGYSALTFLHIIQGELSKAQEDVDSTYAIFKQLNNAYQMAEAYFNMALVFEAKSDGENAIKYYKIADSIYLLEKDNYSRSTCHTNMGAVFFYQSDFKNSLKYFLETERFLNTINFVSEAHILAPINIGEAHFYLKDYIKAEKYLTNGYNLAIQKKAGRMQNIASSFLGKLFYEAKKYDISEKYLLESFAISEKSNETDLYLNTSITLAKLYAAKNEIVKANFYYDKAYTFIKKIDNSKYTWWALYEYGLFYYAQNKCDSAIKFFKDAIVIVERESQNLFGGKEAKELYNADARKVDLYNKIVVCLAKVGKKDEALYYADKSNNQAIKEQADKAGFVTNDAEKANAIKKGGELLQKKNAVEQAINKEKAKPENEQNKQLIASLESVKNVTETDYTNYIEQLQKKYQDLQAYFSNTNPKDFKNYIEDIPDSTIVVLYLINDNQLLIFTVTNKETGIKVIELKQDINKQAGRFLSVLRNPNNATGTGSVTLRSTIKPIDDIRGDFKAEASALYDLLITPIADEMKGKKNICFIPNGKLSNIPFQSLGYLDESKTFHFLMEDYAIFYTSKIDIFRKNFKKRKMESSLALFGNPDKSLPGATIEANQIGKMIPGSVVYIEEQATEDKAKESLAKYNYIHFATHGVLDYDKIENSYLLFGASAGENNDGKLTIAEINGLIKQTSSLVVLSACETAVSKEEVKGFYISPTNAFLTNRVDAVIGSLWKVPDETTNLLLQEFYANIEKKGMSNVQALRNAQATVSSNPKYNHPFYWSAFVLYGEWR